MPTLLAYEAAEAPGMGRGHRIRYAANMIDGLPEEKWNSDTKTTKKGKSTKRNDHAGERCRDETYSVSFTFFVLFVIFVIFVLNWLLRRRGIENLMETSLDGA